MFLPMCLKGFDEKSQVKETHIKIRNEMEMQRKYLISEMIFVLHEQNEYLPRY